MRTSKLNSERSYSSLILCVIAAILYITPSSASAVEKTKERDVNIAEASNEPQDHNYYILNNQEFFTVDHKYYNRISVYRYKDHTEVDIMCFISYNSQWLNVSSQCYIIDPETGDRYQIHSLKGGAPLDRNIVVEKQKGRLAVVTCIFPPLPKKLKVVNFREDNLDGVVIPDNTSGPFTAYDIKVRKKRAYPTTIYEGRVIKLEGDF